MASEVGSFFSEQERDSALARNDALRPSVFRVQACAIRHALAHPDSGYPRSLAAMGDCLGKRLAADRPKGLVVEYVAAPRDAAGRIPSFVIHARARGKNASSDGAATVFGDTSGLVGDVLSRYEANRVWMHVEVIDEIAQLRTCALLARAQRDGVAPATIADMAATLGRFERGDLRAYLCDTDRLAYAARREAHDSIGASDGYRVSYVPREDGSGRMSEFEIAARPIAYGESGIRSYFVRSDGGIHVTLADRAATASDPVTPPCLYGEKRKSLDRYTSTPSCAPMPSLRPPMVTLVHDSVATTGEIFTVAVRRADDPSRAADSTYEHSLACATAKVAPHWRPPRQNGYGDFRLGSELECRVDLESRPPFVNERMRIVVYTRDRTGAFGRAQRVVPVVRSNESTRWTSR
jgi:hypothetical protein